MGRRQSTRGEPITILAGMHVGCFELFGNESIRNIADLKGKTVGVTGSGVERPYVHVRHGRAYRARPRQRHPLGHQPIAHAGELFADGKIDAFLGFPPEPQDLRARRIGHVVVNSAVDRPWSQYFCCMLAGNSEFCAEASGRDQTRVAGHPEGRRSLRHRTGECRATARRWRLHPRYDYALQTLSELPYDKWREYDPEDTLRFYALRLHEVGFIKSSPQKIIAEGTDWRFLNELKRELKA